MKRNKWFLPVLMVLMIFTASTIKAQFRLGIKGGANIATVKYNKAVFNSDNITGFHVGPIIEFMPKLGIGADAAILYSQKGFRYAPKGFPDYDKDLKSSYLEIPVNVKMKIGLPVVSPYIAAGPYINFLLSDDEKRVSVIAKEIFGSEGLLQSKTFGAGLNFTAGLEILKRLQVGLTYNLGLTNNYSTFTIDDIKYSGKERNWLISATVFI